MFCGSIYCKNKRCFWWVNTSVVNVHVYMMWSVRNLVWSILIFVWGMDTAELLRDHCWFYDWYCLIHLVIQCFTVVFDSWLGLHSLLHFYCSIICRLFVAVLVFSPLFDKRFIFLVSRVVFCHQSRMSKCFASVQVQRQFMQHRCGELWHLLSNTNSLVGVSKSMQTLKLCSNKILQ